MSTNQLPQPLSREDTPPFVKSSAHSPVGNLAYDDMAGLLTYLGSAAPSRPQGQWQIAMELLLAETVTVWCKRDLQQRVLSRTFTSFPINALTPRRFETGQPFRLQRYKKIIDAQMFYPSKCRMLSNGRLHPKLLMYKNTIDVWQNSKAI